MQIFIKYILRSMLEKKGRFLLLLVAITISTGLLVASTGLVNIILDSFISPQLEAFENKEIMISSSDESEKFFSDEGMSTAGLDKDSILKEIYVMGNIIDDAGTDDETILNVPIRARNVKDINSSIIIQGDLKDFNGQSCIISERTAKEKKLKLHDHLDIVIGGVSKSFEIVAISGAQGAFYADEKTSFTVFVPYEYLSSDLGMSGKYNTILADSSEKTMNEGIEKFNKNNTSFTADKLYDEDDIKSQMNTVTSILYIMLIVVVIMSSIIIYSSFKLIITERLTTIGTFLSQGATVSKVKSILYLESLIYGIFGGVLGNVLGVAGLYIINRLISPLKDYGIYGKVTIEPYYIITGMIFAIILSFISSYVPVRRISRLQVKDVILNDVRISKTIGWKKFIVGMAFIIISLILYFIFNNNLGNFTIVLIAASLIGIILAYPKVIDILSKGIYRLLRGRSRNVVYAVNNLRTSKILLGNITLIIVSLVSIITITSLGSSMINVIEKAYTDLDFDITIDNISTIRGNGEESTADRIVKELKELGVDEDQINLFSQQSGAIDIKDSDKDLFSMVTAVNPDTFIDYNKYLELDKQEYDGYFQDFRTERSGVIITTTLNKTLNKKVGDMLEITCNGIKKELKVVGIIDGKLFNGGRFALINSKYMYDLFQIPSANVLTFKTDKDPEEMLKDLKPILRETGSKAVTKEEMCESELENSQVIVKTLNIFSYIAIVIAALGIVNNVTISFLQRKSEFAILSSVGMENTGRTKIIFAESFASVTWAMIITSLYCIFLLKLFSILIKYIGLDMSINLDYKSLPVIYIISLLIVLIATIPVYFRSRKLSIIEELKYE